jgi:thioredoxin-like negative regulator of GroEL
MNLITTTLIAYSFLLIFSTNLSGVSLSEEQIINLGRKLERAGNYKNALELYERYQSENSFSQKIDDRIKIIKPMADRDTRSENVEKITYKQTDSQPVSYLRPNREERKIYSSPKKIYAIQVLTTKSAYRKSAEREKRRFENLGLNCYLKEGNWLYLRCNPSENRDDLESGIDILERARKGYFVVTDENVPINNYNQSTSSTQNREPASRVREERRVEPKKEETQPQSQPQEEVIINKTVTSADENPNNNRNPLLMNPRDRINSRPDINRNPRDITENGRDDTDLKNERLHLLKGGKSKFNIADGYKALNSKQLSKAKEIFSDILKYNDKDIDASFGYALAFMNEGDWIKAYITLGKVIDSTDREDIHKTYKSINYNMNLKEGWKNVGTNPDKAIAYFQKAGEVEMTSDVSEGLAYAFNNNKEFDRAIPEAKKLYMKKRDYKSANLLVEAYLKADKPDKAREFFESLEPAFQANMEYNPKRDELILEAKKLIDEEHYHQAKSILRELYLMFPTNLKVLLYFAKVYQEEGKFKNALEYYRTVLSKDEMNLDALMGITEIYIATEKYDEALQTLSTLKDNNVQNAEKMINDVKLKLYLKDGNSKEAIVLAKEMLLEDPTNVKLYVILGDLNVEQKRNRDAYFYYGRAFQLSPDSFDVRMKLLNLLLEQNLFDQTQTLLSKFDGFQLVGEQRTILRDFYIKFYKKYTAVSLEEKDYEFALKGAKAGLQMEPDDTFFIESAGWAGLNSKQYNDAIFYFSKILAKDPENYTIRYGMGLAYVNLKQFNKAREYFKYAEKSSDVDLLYKVAEIYKDTGYKKDSYRVIKLIEELGRRSISTGKIPAKSVEASPTFTDAPSAVSTTNSQRDSMNTFNPFIVGGSGANYSPPKVIEPVPETQRIPSALPSVVPQPDQIEVKKKSGSWF